MYSRHKIRKATTHDVEAIMKLIKELAEFELAPDEVANSVDELRMDMFTHNLCDAFVAEYENEVVGFALYYISYSTWKGKCVYLEDLYVKEAFRKYKMGSDLFDKVVEEAKRLNVRRMDWQVLEWNETAIAFYKKKEATLDPEWINGRLFF